ncbi:MAG: solute:sodium symporter family transporter [Proteobacteria bacterium]|nr:solute:sodium symporter family transporter [Pseudomonadota bacterium]
MSLTELTSVGLTCLFFMGLVAWISYRRARHSTQDTEGYFLAGRGLSATFIAGSLLLTNLSAEQLIGLNGSAYGFNMSAMGWEVTAAVATVAMAFFFLPRYLRGGFTTLPQFLADRYDDDVRRISVVLFLLGYGLVTIPSVLYAGSVAVLKLFDVPALTGLSYSSALFLTVICIGAVGALYAILGGMKAVAVSDTMNGIGLLIIGVAVPVLGLQVLGAGDVGEGLRTLTTEHTEKLNAIGAGDDPTPFGTLFTGMVFANLFYWCSNQYVIQRTLSARSFAEGQKGVLFSGFFKVLVPLFMMIPGVIAFHLYGSELASIDLAYPQLVRDTLPVWAMGFFLAVLLGAVFSSFNSLINSAATMFTLDVLEPWMSRRAAVFTGTESREQESGDAATGLPRRGVSDQTLVRWAKWGSVVIALFSLGVAPLLQFAPEGLWQIIRIFTGFYNIPIIAIVLVGMLTTRVPARAVKIAIGFHLVAYGSVQFLLKEQVALHFLHLYAILFVIEVGFMLLMGYWKPAHKVRVMHTPPVDMTPWTHAKACAVTLLSCVVGLYCLFSPLGLVAGGGIGLGFGAVMATLLVVNAVFWQQSVRAHD